jgi:hypothetical protein
MLLGLLFFNYHGDVNHEKIRLKMFRNCWLGDTTGIYYINTITVNQLKSAYTLSLTKYSTLERVILG